MKRTLLSCLAIGIASTSVAQDELVVTIAPTGVGSQWEISAELFGYSGTIRATIADLAFTLTGDGFSDWMYNPAFDSFYFGPPTRIEVTDQSIAFTGFNTLPPLNNPGGPDNSNPFFIGTFNATNVSSFALDGQTNGAGVGTPEHLWFYWNANNTPGTVPYSVVIVPAPASAALLGVFGIAAMRRRR